MRGNKDQRLAKKNRFLLYFIYAALVPFLHTLIVYLLDVFGDREAFYYPGVGYKKCFLNGDYTF